MATRFGQPIQVGLNVGSAIFDLLAVPLREYGETGNILHGLAKGTGSFLKKVSIQLLGVTAKTTVTGSKLFNYLDWFSGGTNRITENKGQSTSLYSRQHKDIASALPHATNTLFEQMGNARDAFVKDPIFGLPSALSKGFVGIFGSISELLLSARNQLDPQTYDQSKLVYKSISSGEEIIFTTFHQCGMKKSGKEEEELNNKPIVMHAPLNIQEEYNPNDVTSSPDNSDSETPVDIDKRFY